MKPLKLFAIGAEAGVVSTLAVSSYHIAFSGASGANDWLAGVPILTVVALESLRLPVAFNLSRAKLTGVLLSVVMLAGLSVITFEAASIGFTNLIQQRVRPIVEAERALDKLQKAQGVQADAAKQRDDKIAQLTSEVETARTHRAAIDKAPELLPPPALQPPPVMQAIPANQMCSGRYKKGGTYSYICNNPAQDAARKSNADAQAKIAQSNADAQAAVNAANTATMAKHADELKAADEAVNQARAKLDAVEPAPDTRAADADLAEAQRKVDDARAMNPMFQVAAAWQKTPAEKLTPEQFEMVKHWAVIGLAGAAAVTSAMAAFISSLPDRGPSKLIPALRAIIAARRKTLRRIAERVVEIPGPEREVIKTVELVREVPVDRIITQDVVREVPVDRIITQDVVREVPVDRIVLRDKEVPVEHVVIKNVEIPVPGPVQEKVVIKYLPYDVNSGHRVKPDGTLGEVASIRSAS